MGPRLAWAVHDPGRVGMTFTTMHDVRADELREGDWPVSIAGYRPIERIRTFPRKRQIVLTIDGQRHTLHPTKIIKRVRRPVMASIQYLRTFDPNDTQVR